MTTLIFNATSGNEARLEVRTATEGDEIRIGAAVRWKQPATEQDNAECDAFFARILAEEGLEPEGMKAYSANSLDEQAEKISTFLGFGESSGGVQ